MQSVEIIKSDEVFNALSECFDIVVFLDMDLLVFEYSKEAFHGNIVKDSSFTVHRDFDPMFFKKSSMLFAGILTALIGVEYFWYALLCKVFL